ncbi:MAG: methyltransferase domain-containing protein [Chloroflexi bacterium]|nr:methyltransferase domain-containing protein [Chloroflexota bacterium]
MTADEYVHGYSGRENARLLDQANTLAELLHYDTIYPAGSRVLEAGCGVGAQTVILARQNPQTQFTSIDISAVSIASARGALAQAQLSNVEFRQADIFDLPFPAESFDHVFVCFVLEHLADPLLALERLRAVLKRDGTLTVIEGDHDSAYYYPRSPRAQRTIGCLVEIQARLGGDALIGRQLYPLLRHAGLNEIHVEPRQVYVDSSKPAWVEGFTKNTFIAMVEGVKQAAIEQGLIDLADWQAGISDLKATAGTDGTFCYTFFKAKAVK